MKKKCVIVLESFGRLRAGWSSLYNPAEHDFVLIASSSVYQKCIPEDLVYFKKTFSTEDFSFENLKIVVDAAVKEVGTTYKYTRIISNDEFVLVVSGRLRDFFKMPGSTEQMMQLFTDKLKMKERFGSSNIKIPKYSHFSGIEFQRDPENYINSIIDNISFPMFAKKTDSAGSDDIQVIYNIDSLALWCEARKGCCNYEIDEFISGKLFHCDSVIRQGRIVDVLVSEYSCPNAEFLKLKNLGSVMLDQKSDLCRRLSDFNYSVLNAMSPLPNGVTHLEVFMLDSGEFVFLEVAARVGGGLIVDMYEIYLGANLKDVHYKIQGELCAEVGLEQNGPYSAWMWFPKREGTILKLNKPNISSEYHLTWDVVVGEIVTNPKKLWDKVGAILLWNSDAKVLLNDFRYLADQFDPVVIE